MFRFIRFAAGFAIAAMVLSLPLLRSHAGISTNTVSVIVEFKDDPAAVYAAKLKKSGAAPSNDQIQAYRNTLSAAQNQFLTALKATVPTAQLESITSRTPRVMSPATFSSVTRWFTTAWR